MVQLAEWFLFTSVTRFGEKFATLGEFSCVLAIFECLLSIWQNCDPRLAKLLCYWVYFHCYKWPKTNKLTLPSGPTAVPGSNRVIGNLFIKFIFWSLVIRQNKEKEAGICTI